MKIIAEGPRNTYIAEVTKEDVEAIVGVIWLRDEEAMTILKAQGIPGTVSYGQWSPNYVGATITISERFRNILSLEGRRDECKQAAAKLRAYAQLLDGVATIPVTPAKEKPS